MLLIYLGNEQTQPTVSFLNHLSYYLCRHWNLCKVNNEIKKLDCNKLQPLHLTYITLTLDKVI